MRIVTPRLFETLGMRLLEGRDFTPRDSAGRPRVVVVNERLAREFWPTGSALGRRVRMSWGDDELSAYLDGELKPEEMEQLARDIAAERPEAAVW